MNNLRFHISAVACLLLAFSVVVSCSRVPNPQNSKFEFEFQLKGILDGMHSFEKAFKRLPQDDVTSGISWRAECLARLQPITGEVNPVSGKVALSENDKILGEVQFRHHRWQVSANLQFLEGKSLSEDPVLAFVPIPASSWWQIEARNCSTSAAVTSLVLYADGSSKLVKLSELIPIFLEKRSD